jgi:hypothetical protein
MEPGSRNVLREIRGVLERNRDSFSMKHQSWDADRREDGTHVGLGQDVEVHGDHVRAERKARLPRKE